MKLTYLSFSMIVHFTRRVVPPFMRPSRGRFRCVWGGGLPGKRVQVGGGVTLKSGKDKPLLGRVTLKSGKDKPLLAEQRACTGLLVTNNARLNTQTCANTLKYQLVHPLSVCGNSPPLDPAIHLQSRTHRGVAGAGRV